MFKKIPVQLIRISCFFAGLFITSLAIVLLVQSRIGADPWSVLHVGISLHIPITTGRVNQLIGVAIIFVCLALKIKPGLGTIINTYFIGFFIDLINRNLIVKPPKSILFSCIYLITGILLFGTGTGIHSNFGAGSRDNLIKGLARTYG